MIIKVADLQGSKQKAYSLSSVSILYFVKQIVNFVALIFEQQYVHFGIPLTGNVTRFTKRL